MDAVYKSRELRVKPAPFTRLEERVIDVASRNQAEHEQAQHNHYLLLHNGQTRHILVASRDRRASVDSGAASQLSASNIDQLFKFPKRSSDQTTDGYSIGRRFVSHLYLQTLSVSVMGGGRQIIFYRYDLCMHSLVR